MDEGLIKVTPDKERARSIIKMSEITLERINETNLEKYASILAKDYYDIIRELLSILLLLDGYKTYGENAHKNQIDYIRKHYSQFLGSEISLIEDLRIKRNKITYDGFFLDKDYLKRRIGEIKAIISKTKGIIMEKLK